MLKQLYLTIILFFFSCSLNAQEEKQDSVIHANKGVLSTVADGVIHFTDDVTTAVLETGRKIRSVGKEFNAIDTNYISPNLYNLAFMLEQSTWYENYRLGNNSKYTPQSLSFSPSLGTKLGIYFGWRWIFLGYTFDIEDLFGGNKNKAKTLSAAIIAPE